MSVWARVADDPVADTVAISPVPIQGALVQPRPVGVSAGQGRCVEEVPLDVQLAARQAGRQRQPVQAAARFNECNMHAA